MVIISFQHRLNMQRKSRRTISLLLIASIYLHLCTNLLSGCSSHSPGFIFIQQDITITVQINSNANNGNAVAVDILMPLTAETQTAVEQLSARQWFAQKAQFHRDYTSGQDYWVLPYEYVPGTVVPPIKVSLKDQTKSIIVFADYQTEGEHRFRTTRGENMVLTLNKSDFTIADPNSNSTGSENE